MLRRAKNAQLGMLPMKSTKKVGYSILLDEKLYKRLSRESKRLGVSKSLIIHSALSMLFDTGNNLEVRLDS